MHIPVLLEEVVHFLNPKESENFIDCTAGGGGHLEAILKKNGEEGRVMAFEWDKELYEKLLKKNYKRVILVNESYTLLRDVVEEHNFHPVSGILFDLGFSSYHIDKSGRGFSFMYDEPLDMRYSKDNPLTAHQIVNSYKKKDLLYILREYGEEDYTEAIVNKILSNREVKKIETTQDLVEIIEDAVPVSYKKKSKINCATKTFQALRIAVNGELLGLNAALYQALEVLSKGGRLVVICFHSKEEKVVKDFFDKTKIKVLTSKAVTPSKKEVEYNIRSRSAKLYAAVKE